MPPRRNAAKATSAAEHQARTSKRKRVNGRAGDQGEEHEVALAIQKSVVETAESVKKVSEEMRSLRSRLQEIEGGHDHPPVYTTGRRSAQQARPSLNRGFEFVHPDILRSVVRGNFDVYDMWRLDEQRYRNSFPTAPLALASDDTLFKRYPDCDSIIRPWIVYGQIRESVEPGILYYLSFHTLHLYDFQEKYPKNVIAVLRYHFTVITKRLGARCPREDWERIDPVVLTTDFLPRVGDAKRLLKGRPRPVDQNGAWRFDEKAHGSLTSQEFCAEYSNLQPCVVWECNRRHGCTRCGLDVLHSVNGTCPYNQHNGQVVNSFSPAKNPTLQQLHYQYLVQQEYRRLVERRQRASSFSTLTQPVANYETHGSVYHQYAVPQEGQAGPSTWQQTVVGDTFLTGPAQPSGTPISTATANRGMEGEMGEAGSHQGSREQGQHFDSSGFLTEFGIDPNTFFFNGEA